MRLRPAAALFAATALLLSFAPAASAGPIVCVGLYEPYDVLHLTVRPFEFCLL